MLPIKEEQIHYSVNMAVGQETYLFVMQWQVTILLCSRVASLTDL